MASKNVRRVPWAVLFVVVASAWLAAQASGDGAISGRITDVKGGAIPGVRVTATRGDERHEAITSADGRFSLRRLRLGTYDVVTDLQGFFMKSGAITLSQDVPRAHVEWRLEVGCLDDGVHVIPTPRDAARMARAIVHARIVSDDGPMLWSYRPECPGRAVQSYTAEVLDVAIPGSTRTERGSTQQLFHPAHGSRLDAGAEYVAFIGTGLMLQVVSGRVSASAGERVAGLTVEDALEALAE